MPTGLPETIRNSIPDDLMADAVTWWQQLSDKDRDDLQQLCDSRKELFLFETFSREEPSPRIIGGKFIPHDDAFGTSEWQEDYFQYLLDNPELMIAYEPVFRTFHIGCSRHLSARECFAMGQIPEGFACPFEAADCLMTKILAHRPSVGLKLIISEKHRDGLPPIP
ncbi:MAG: hypothetical protein U0903_07055 [Planctomycetales bacterium]